MKKNIILGLIGFVVGGVASYLYCKKRFEESCYEVDESVIDEEATVENYHKSIEINVNPMSFESAPIIYDSNSTEVPKLYHKIIAKLYTSDDNELDPKPITESQFSDECQEYDKTTLLYYDNGIVTDDRDEPVDEIDMVVGINNLSCFGYGSSDKDVLYVRNHKLKMDYEILKQNSEYQTDN